MTTQQVLTAALLCGLACICAVSAEFESRIVGGQVTTIADAPYIVYLKRNGRFICGGTLVNDRIVVTAAHCTHGQVASDFTVVGGSSFLSSGGVARSVNKIITPREYNPDTQNMDVSILRLSSPMTGNNIKPVSICSAAVPTGATVKVSGWGLTMEDGSTSNQLRTVNVPTISKASCQRSYFNELTASMMCAGENGKKDSCQGDSGGPLVYKSQLCGVVSWGAGCARDGFPGVYTDTFLIRSYLEKTIKENSGARNIFEKLFEGLKL